MIQSYKFVDFSHVCKQRSSPCPFILCNSFLVFNHTSHTCILSIILVWKILRAKSGLRPLLQFPNIVHRWQPSICLSALFDKTRDPSRKMKCLSELSYQVDLARARPTSCSTSRLSLRIFLPLTSNSNAEEKNVKTKGGEQKIVDKLCSNETRSCYLM